MRKHWTAGCPADHRSDQRRLMTRCGNTTPVCSAGTCGTTCATGQTICNNTCVNTQTSAANCGACGRTCNGGGAGCFNLHTSTLHCGTCRTACGTGRQLNPPYDARRPPTALLQRVPLRPVRYLF